MNLCNAGCEVKMTDTSCEVQLCGKAVVTFSFSECTRIGIWLLPLTQKVSNSNTVKIVVEQQQVQTLHMAYSAQQTSSHAELAQYHHQSLFLPQPSTISKSLNNK